MNKQYKEEIQKRKKVYLVIRESKMGIAMCLYSSMVGAGDNVSTALRTEVKEVEDGFLFIII